MGRRTQDKGGRMQAITKSPFPSSLTLKKLLPRVNFPGER